MIEKNLIIAAAVRNCEKHLHNFLKNVDHVSNMFKKTKCIFVESDSSDNSLQMLQEYKNFKKDTEVISLGNLQPRIQSRTERISTARNIYLNIAERLKNDYDTLLVMDADEVNAQLFDEESIISNFNYDNWDMICANQEVYYDLWALRHPEWMPFDCWAKAANKPSFMNYESARKIYVESRFIEINQSHPLIKVNSAFGGAAFIKINSIKGSRHIGIIEGKEICEWVPFCMGLNEGNSNIYINPKFINLKNKSEHIK
jgi:glycosyltransferase involved in cell wall biosynthesis